MDIQSDYPTQNDSTPFPLPTNESLKEYVQNRIRTFQYLSKLHEGNAYYMNTVLISKEALVTMYDDKTAMKKRALKWFNLGHGIGGILGLPNPAEFVRALNALMSEYEHESGEGNAKQKMKRIFSGKGSQRPASSVDAGGSQGQDMGAYSYMDLLHVPFDMDYIQTALAFFDVLAAAYGRFIENQELCRSQTFSETVMKIDHKMRKIISMVVKELDTIAKSRLNEELSVLATPMLESLYSS
ncbi:hypothetical protein HDU85_003829 [Gaertneriomyces sp. JEL0708]|nr:hypothetical protein HDU85_003829 [Gaertneriomyces sp. JEL0708]